MVIAVLLSLFVSVEPTNLLRCRYAHGVAELRNLNYKSKQCPVFYANRPCSNGIVCGHIHDETPEQVAALQAGKLQNACSSTVSTSDAENPKINRNFGANEIFQKFKIILLSAQRHSSAG